ncbi:hypothetical protein F2Q68_00011932 [Brassica cretica]|uniref:Uncharacterized protein n=1 Tax=Brassica cretica TaxID=69181 RepID=A0A8S9KNK1_BRACR|nr:hypothetical protein F2Q68_00011932 [Brassica cretica]
MAMINHPEEAISIRNDLDNKKANLLRRDMERADPKPGQSHLEKQDLKGNET